MNIRIQYNLKPPCTQVAAASTVLYRVPDEHSDPRMWEALFDQLRRFRAGDGRRGYLEYTDNPAVRGILNRFLFKYQ